MGQLGKRVTATLAFVSPEGERILHRHGKCSGKLCPLKKPAKAKEPPK